MAGEESVATKERKERVVPFQGDVTIEVGDNRNRNIAFAPTKDIFRGTWLQVNLMGDERVEQTSQMPDIPGMCIRIDGRNRRAVIYDPLGQEKHSLLRAKVAKAFKASFGTEAGPDRPREYRDIDDNMIKTWLWEMAKLVRGSPPEGRTEEELALASYTPRAKVVDGTLPSREEIERLPGQIPAEHYNSRPTRRFLKDPPIDERRWG